MFALEFCKAMISLSPIFSSNEKALPVYWKSTVISLPDVRFDSIIRQFYQTLLFTRVHNTEGFTDLRRVKYRLYSDLYGLAFSE